MQAVMLPDKRRLHLQDGPIDLIIEAWGPDPEVRLAYDQAVHTFEPLLSDLVSELPSLRQPVTDTTPSFRGPVAARMLDATLPYRERFITPMAAVAGAVADHVLSQMTAVRNLSRAYVNDGGDIALHIGPGETLNCGIVPTVAAPELLATIHLTADLPVRGVATSGAATKGTGGRSFSLGIADAVTVLATSAAAADAAATIIANAVDLPGHPGIERVPASSLDPDSDLGDRLITFKVPALTSNESEKALGAGWLVAEELRNEGLIYAAVLCLQGAIRISAQPGLSLLAA